MEINKRAFKSALISIISMIFVVKMVMITIIMEVIKLGR